MIEGTSEMDKLNINWTWKLDEKDENDKYAREMRVLKGVLKEMGIEADDDTLRAVLDSCNGDVNLALENLI